MRKRNAAILLLLAMVATVSDGARGEEANGGKALSEEKKNLTKPPVLNEKYQYYEVCGCCEKDVKCDLAKKCVGSSDGKKYDSMTDWKLKWDYGRNRGSAWCIADAFTVTVDITFHLPKWVRTVDATQGLADKWEKYAKSLLAHEKQHEQIALDAANELTHAVAELPSARTCGELDRNVRRLVDERSRRLIEDQKTYDAATNHGAAQGALFP